jgi:MYXO-CTERM domain-containing protein
VWGGPPSEIAAKDSGVKPALDLAYAPRDLQLASVVARDVPAIGVTSSGGGGARAGRGNSGCGCDTGGASGGIVMLALLVLVRRRR